MAVAGVAIGSAGLLIALSIVHGFKSTINEKIAGFAPHITVQNQTGELIERSDTLEFFTGSIPGVETVQAVALGEVMIQSAGDISGSLLKGVPGSGGIEALKSYIVEGEYLLSAGDSGLPGIILGAELARTIGAEIGSRVTVYALDGLPTPLNTPEILQFTLTGIYQTGIARFDHNFALTGLEPAKKLFGLSAIQSSALEVNTAGMDQIFDVYTTINNDTPFPYITDNIFQRFRNMFAWVDLQEEIIPFVISVMVLVAAFNLIGTVLMMVLERTRDVGILKTMGAKNRSIRRIFLFEGLFVAALGLLLGIGISLLFYWLQASYQIIPLDEQNYYMTTVPVEPHLLDFVIVSALTFFLCALASWLPARIASKTDPVAVLSFGK